MRPCDRNTAGFTLVELLVTTVIVSILALGAFPAAELALRRTKEHELRKNLLSIRAAIDAYKHAHDEGRIARSENASGYPPTLEALVDGVPDLKSPHGGKLYFLRRLPRDPFSHEPQALPAATWGKRSYASSAQLPKEGLDVFDVFSLSGKVGINGVPYREW